MVNKDINDVTVQSTLTRVFNLIDFNLLSLLRIAEFGKPQPCPPSNTPAEMPSSCCSCNSSGVCSNCSCVHESRKELLQLRPASYKGRCHNLATPAQAQTPVFTNHFSHSASSSQHPTACPSSSPRQASPLTDPEVLVTDLHLSPYTGNS